MVTTDQLRKLKTLLGIPLEDKEKEPVLEFVLEDARQRIISYCHVDEVPDGAVSTMYRMAIEIYRHEQFGNEENTGVVKSITVGDTSTSFGSADDSYSNSVLKKYESVLKKFRKVVFR